MLTYINERVDFETHLQENVELIKEERKQVAKHGSSVLMSEKEFLAQLDMA